MSNPAATILIVDDELQNRKLLETLLKPEGYLTVTAANGEDALASVTLNAPDLILLDVMMPGMDGYQVAAVLKANPATSNIPLIMVTALVDRSARLAGLNAGAEEFLTKPVDRAELWLRVRNLLRLKELSNLLQDQNEHLEREVQARTQSLRESEFRFRQVAENIRDVFFLREVDGNRILYVSPAYERVWGRSCESLYADPGSWIEAIHPDDRARIRKEDNESLVSGSVKLEYRIVQPNGAVHWIESRDFPVRDAGGQVVRIAGIVKDITEYKESEQELQESERRFSDMLGNVEMVTVMLDTNGSITYCNNHLLDLTGWRRDDVIGKNWFEFFVPLDRHVATKAAFATLLADLPYARHRENYILTRSGEHRLIRWNNSVLRTGAGEVMGSASIGEDITERTRAERALQESDARYRHLIEQAVDGIFVSDKQGTYAMVNSSACELLGYTEAELVGMNGSLTYPEADRHLHAVRMESVSAGKTLRFERMVLRKDRSTFPAEVSLKLLDDGMVQVITHDITERHAQAQKISRLNRIHEVLSGINSAIVRIRDRRELFREACRIVVEHGRFTLGWIGVLDHATGKLVAADQSGLPDAGVGGDLFNGPAGLVPVGPAASALRDRRASTGNVIEDEYTPMGASQGPDTYQLRRAAIELGAKSVIALPLIVEREIFGVLVLYASEPDFFDAEEIKLLDELAGDISFSLEFIAKGEKADYLAYYDALTGLANSGLFRERLAQHIRTAARVRHKLAVILIDLERFKNINDSLGQQAGDELLRQVAEWLTRTTGDSNLVARLNADHFALVMPEVREEGNLGHLIEKRMEAMLEHPFHLNDAVFRVAARVGVALFPGDGATAETLFRNAESALKKAKADGDKYLFFAQEMTETVAVRLTLENQLRRALDNEEFVLHYQPKIALHSGKVTGAEALIRWNDPNTGLVPPGRFIPVLEETGLIYEVGRWALQKAIDDYLHWRTAGLPAVRLSVNVSPMQLRNRGFVAEIEQAIGIDARAPAGLELEITESLIMEDIKNSIASLQALRSMGITVAIDDFGTGFSSLSYLAKLPVDSLKIDRSFVVEMTASPAGLALVSTIINLAHSLKLKVVAEGVETAEQSRLLHLLNCDEMQGFLFCKPVPGSEFEERFLRAAQIP